MTRFRALLFGNPLAPWQATEALAIQSALEAGEGLRDPFSGLVFQSPGVTIERDEEPAPEMSDDMARWALALEMIQQHHASAAAFVEDEIRRVANDPAARARWRIVQKRIRAIMDAAEKDAR